MYKRAVCVLLLHTGRHVRGCWRCGNRSRGNTNISRTYILRKNLSCSALLNLHQFIQSECVITFMQVVDLLVAMCRAALESARKSIIFDPYPSVVDPFDPKALAFNPKVQDFIWCNNIMTLCRYDQFIIQEIPCWLHSSHYPSHFIILCVYFPFCCQKRSYDRLQKALDSIMSIREITQVWQITLLIWK